MDPGALDHRAEFAVREMVSTDMGGTQDSWVPQFTAWAGVKYLRGGEGVMQARMQSRNPVIVTIRNSARARQITSEWRVTLRSRSGVVLVAEVREDPRPSERDGFLEMLAEGGYGAS